MHGFMQTLGVLESLRARSAEQASSTPPGVVSAMNRGPVRGSRHSAGGVQAASEVREMDL
jgi:hypothetical protein